MRDYFYYCWCIYCKVCSYSIYLFLFYYGWIQLLNFTLFFYIFSYCCLMLNFDLSYFHLLIYFSRNWRIYWIETEVYILFNFPEVVLRNWHLMLMFPCLVWWGILLDFFDGVVWNFFNIFHFSNEYLLISLVII
jgi:hypothetical protein